MSTNFEAFLRDCMDRGAKQVRLIPRRVPGTDAIQFYAVPLAVSGERFEAEVSGKHVRRLDVDGAVADSDEPVDPSPVDSQVDALLVTNRKLGVDLEDSEARVAILVGTNQGLREALVAMEADESPVPVDPTPASVDDEHVPPPAPVEVVSASAPVEVVGASAPVDVVRASQSAEPPVDSVPASSDAEHMQPDAPVEPPVEPTDPYAKQPVDGAELTSEKVEPYPREFE